MRCSSPANIWSATKSNQYAKLPSYTVFNLHTSYQVTKNFQLYGKIDNIFDKRFATYGTVLRYRSRAQLYQRRRRVHRPALAQPGKAACILCGDAVNVLIRLASPRRMWDDEGLAPFFRRRGVPAWVCST